MRRNWVRLALAAALVTLGLAACGSDRDSGGSAAGGSIQIWDGYTQTEAKVFAHLGQRVQPGASRHQGDQACS